MNRVRKLARAFQSHRPALTVLRADNARAHKLNKARGRKS